jgi:hypothetical protein
MTEHTCNPSTQEAEDFECKASLDYIARPPITKIKEREREEGREGGKEKCKEDFMPLIANISFLL